MLIQYESVNLRPETRARIDQANAIIAEYEAQGFVLTLRQLYYQFVARGIIANNEREYKKLGDVISSGRMAGLISWEAITDRTRFLRDLAHWNHPTPTDIVDACSRQFRLPKWDRQPYYCEVWIEKDALIGVIEGVCEELDVPYLACRGYASASEVWRAGHERFRNRLHRGKSCVVFYLGDHDPSGLDMTRDIQDRLDVFTGEPGGVEVKRLALNMDQVNEHNPPPNPTKMTDSRAGSYVHEFGETCWELDALEPAMIAELIRGEVLAIRDEKDWRSAEREETKAREHLAGVAEHWQGVVKYLGSTNCDGKKKG